MTCNGCKDGPPRFTHTVTVERPGGVADESGKPNLADPNNWVSLGQIQVRFVTRGGSESYIFKQTQATTTHVLFAPRTALAESLDPSMRLRMGDRLFEITFANVINESGRQVQIEAREAK